MTKLEKVGLVLKLHGSAVEQNLPLVEVGGDSKHLVDVPRPAQETHAIHQVDAGLLSGLLVCGEHHAARHTVLIKK